MVIAIGREDGIRPTGYGLPEAPVKVGVGPVVVFNSTMTRLLKLSLTAKSVLLSWLKLPAAIAEGTVALGKVIGTGAPNVPFPVPVPWPGRMFTVPPASATAMSLLVSMLKRPAATPTGLVPSAMAVPV